VQVHTTRPISLTVGRYLVAGHCGRYREVRTGNIILGWNTLSRLVILVFALLIFAAVGIPAWGASGSRPTTRPVPGAPSGSALLESMRVAIKRSGAYHFSASFVVNIPQVAHDSYQIDGDQSTRGNAAHAVVRTSGIGQNGLVPPGKTQTEYVVVGYRVAGRAGHGPWQCAVWSTIGPLLQSVSGVGNVRHPQNLGVARVNGIPTWRVRGTTTITFSGIHRPGPTTLYVSQRDFTLQKATARTTVQNPRTEVEEHQKVAYTRYDERVQFRLPRACAE
jgi:hypothetical protein